MADSVTGRCSKGRASPAGWLVPALGIAIAAGVYLTGTLTYAPASGSPPPTAMPSDDPHMIVLSDRTITFGAEGGDFVIRETRNGVVRELARVPLHYDADNRGSQVVTGAFGHVMVCDESGKTELDRYVFGRADWIRSALSTAEPFLVGPPGRGSIDADGLFVYALDPGPLASTATVHVDFNGRRVLGMTGAAFELLTASETPGPSTCVIGG